MQLPLINRLRRLPLPLRLSLVIAVSLVRVVLSVMGYRDYVDIPTVGLWVLALGILAPLRLVPALALLHGLLQAMVEYAVLRGTVDQVILHTAAKIAVGASIAYLVSRTLDRLEYLEALARNTRERLFVLDSAGRVVHVSAAAAESFGSTPEQMVGGGLASFVPEWYLSSAREMLGAVLGGRRLTHAPIHVLRRSGKKVPVVIRAQPLMHRGETHAIGVIQDLTGPESTHRVFTAALDALDKAICLRTPDDRIVWCNQLFAESVGRSREELIGERANSFGIDPESLGPLASRLASGKPELHEFQAPDGRYVEGAGFPVLDAGGTVMATITVSKDVTARKQAQQRMLEAERLAAVGELAAGLAHNFKNVLAAILLQSDLLSLRPQEAEVIGLRIGQAVEHGSAVVNRLQDLAAGHREVQLQPLRLQEQISEALHMIESRLGQVRVHLDVPDSVKVLADPHMLRQVLDNLVINSIHAMNGQGQLTFTVKPGSGGRIALSVTDTGCGLSAEELKQIFTPFYTTKPGNGGTGLGLPTSLTMIRSMGGEISVVSQPGKGATFTIELQKPEAAA